MKSSSSETKLRAILLCPAFVKGQLASNLVHAEQWLFAREETNDTGRPPRELQPSKVGFFLCPIRFVPRDRFSVRGLNILRTANGAGKLKPNSYEEYLGAFDDQYARLEPQLITALNERWVVDMAEHLGCPPVALTTLAIRRKLFDDYLMRSADYGT